MERLPWPVYELSSLKAIEQGKSKLVDIPKQELFDILSFTLPETKLIGRLSHRFEDWE